MRKRSLIIVGLTVLVLLGGTGVIYAYDSSRSDTIAKGVRVAGIDIGGLTPAAARGRLRARYLPTVEKAVRIHHDRSTWILGPKEARIRTNLDDVLRQAQSRSATGNFLSRTLRRVTGGTVDTDLTPQVTFSDKAVMRTIDKVRKAVDRKPRDAKLDISLAGFDKVSSRVGLKVRAGQLHQQMKAALASPTSERTFVARTTHIKPKVTTNELAKQNGTVLIVDKSRFIVKVYQDLKLSKTYPIAIGQSKYPTPEGLFAVQSKQVDPVWSVPNSPWAGELGGTTVQGGTATNPLKARWMGVTDGVGFHGTGEDASVGRAASHGCMRMHVKDVVDMYSRVPVGSKVLITHS